MKAGFRKITTNFVELAHLGAFLSSRTFGDTVGVRIGTTQRLAGEIMMIAYRAVIRGAEVERDHFVVHRKQDSPIAITLSLDQLAFLAGLVPPRFEWSGGLIPQEYGGAKMIALKCRQVRLARRGRPVLKQTDVTTGLNNSSRFSERHLYRLLERDRRLAEINRRKL